MAALRHLRNAPFRTAYNLLHCEALLDMSAGANTALGEGQYFFLDVRREGIVLYELDEEPPASSPVPAGPDDALRAAEEYFADRLPHARASSKVRKSGHSTLLA